MNIITNYSPLNNSTTKVNSSSTVTKESKETNNLAQGNTSKISVENLQGAFLSFAGVGEWSARTAKECFEQPENKMLEYLVDTVRVMSAVEKEKIGSQIEKFPEEDRFTAFKALSNYARDHYRSKNAMKVLCAPVTRKGQIDLVASNPERYSSKLKNILNAAIEKLPEEDRAEAHKIMKEIRNK